MVNSSLVAADTSGSFVGMGGVEKELTLNEEIADETRKLRARGVPEFLASIQAAGIVAKRRQQSEAQRGEAMASHCNEP